MAVKRLLTTNNINNIKYNALTNIHRNRRYNSTSSTSSINHEEINKFKILASEWWNHTGEFSALHSQNNIRVQFIKSHIQNHFQCNLDNHSKPLSSLSILDIGCGGGILSESLSRLGSSLTGIDATSESIETAKYHASLDPDLDIKYMNTTVEEHVDKNILYDVVCSVEVIEHVNNPREFILNASKLVKPNGLIFLSSINKTLKAKLLAVDLAEFVLGWVPKGTHDFEKFQPPNYVINSIPSFELIECKGMNLDLKLNWILSDDTDVNYILVAKRKSDHEKKL